MKTRIDIGALLAALPEGPGVYLFYDDTGKILYVGKASNLKKRVSSYFNKNHDSGKTRVLVSKIADIRPIVVEMESDALLLENNLIKQYQPRYNVLLKDDKTFPWICVKNERFPRIFPTRNLVRDGSQYFGPYTSGLMVKTVLDLIKQLYKLRNCNYHLSEENIQAGKFRVCLEYHIGNCLAPCIGKETEESYNESIAGAKHILKGNISVLLVWLRELMMKLASEHQFEQAQQIKEKIEIVERYRSKSAVVNPAISNVEVFSMVEEGRSAYVNFLRVIDGAIIQAHNMELKKQLDESPEELLSLAIHEIRQRFSTSSKEIILPFEIAFLPPDIKVTVPRIGDKKKLLELSERNAKYFRMDRMRQEQKANPANRGNKILETLMTDLRLPGLPVHMECFDNSNLQGTNPVAACVVFRNGRPSGKDYRHFNIKTVDGIDDFASMKEIIYRRYKRLLEEGQSLPQLIIIDGGKGQLSAAVEALESLELRGKIAIIGIAKRLEEIFFPDDSVPLYLDKKSVSLKIIQQMRNEAHRFGISFHRDKRSRSLLVSELDQIKGIGDKTKEALLNYFGSVAAIRKADPEELATLVGQSKASLLIKGLGQGSEEGK
jgi:excinuclease ABC subunit C